MTKSLLDRARQVAALRGTSLARLGTLVANDGKYFLSMERGRSVTSRTFYRSMARLDDIERLVLGTSCEHSAGAGQEAT